MRIERGQIRGCLTEMGKGLLGGACLEWGLSGWAGQPYGNTGERQAGAFNSARRKRRRRGGLRGREEPPLAFNDFRYLVVGRGATETRRAASN